VQWNVKRSETAVHDWLSGHTVLPSDPHALRALAKLDPHLFAMHFSVPQPVHAQDSDRLPG
ncbi:MAG: hypothetical protein PHP23_12390, partial [Desulfobacterales bacterium]|nr:hypothetical protein [Desulfobacterales bacterium]